MNKLNHLAIIVDGNGRWAKSIGKIRSYGHLKGYENLKKIINYVNDNLDIKYISLFVFSTENFKRSKDEVDYLMNLFKKGFKEEKDVYIKKNMKVVFSYKKEGLSKDIISIIEEVESSTKDNTGLVVNFCLNYGGRSEIVDACKKIIDDKIDKNDITEDLFKDYLYNKLPDIDLMIRTSGEQRISNFMLWSLSYSELYFTKTYFPAFTTNELLEIIDDFNNRDRRYGNAK
ncbi:MAG: polyprenyl diphosphate synthase [Tenericutes bacterium]|nr:polyprenyl diphosphate synthase [Mycoplasmatota bacterium]